MPVADSKIETRVLVVPTPSLGDSDGCMRTVKLRHPKTDTAATFLHNSASNKLYELLAFSEEHRSWFVGQKVVSDGRLFLATPVNPVFLLLPYLVKATRLVPLDQMLEDDKFPLTEEILGMVKGLDKVAESKGDADLNVWKYSQELALTWLKERVERVAKVLEKQGIDLTQGAVSHNYKQAGVEPSSVEYRRVAFGIVSEYLSSDLATALEEILGLVEDKPVAKGIKRQSTGVQKDGPKAKKGKIEDPVEDYSKKSVKATIKEEQTAKQKALAVSAKGTKSISSFFVKKT